MKFIGDDGHEITPKEWADEIVDAFDGPEDADANCAGIWAFAQAILRGFDPLAIVDDGTPPFPEITDTAKEQSFVDCRDEAETS
jgi:hypothetical protein